jgi:hypothetical protein
MRGEDQQQNHIFSYLSPEMRVRKDHPLRAIRAMVDEVLTQLSRRFDTMYASVGRPSIPAMSSFPTQVAAGPPRHGTFAVPSFVIVSARLTESLKAD